MGTEKSEPGARVLLGNKGSEIGEGYCFESEFRNVASYRELSIKCLSKITLSLPQAQQGRPKRKLLSQGLHQQSCKSHPAQSCS